MGTSNKVPKDGIITVPGHYELKCNFGSNRTIGIKIECSDVTLDLNGYSVFNESIDGNSFGIYAMSTKNVIIENGNVELADFGIHAPYSDSLILRNIDFSRCTYIGANIGGTDTYVGNCLFSDITGTRREAYAIGINMSEGQNAIIENNTFLNFYRQPNAPSSMIGEGVGILLGHETKFCGVRNNIIHNIQEDIHTYGIWAAGKDHEILYNKVKNLQHGMMMGASTAKYNVFTIQHGIADSVGIAGGGGHSECNLIANFKNPYEHSTIGDVDELLPAMITLNDIIYSSDMRI